MTVTFERPRRPIRTDPSFIRRIDYPFMKNILKFTESEHLHGFFSAISPWHSVPNVHRMEKDTTKRYNSIGIS